MYVEISFIKKNIQNINKKDSKLIFNIFSIAKDVNSSYFLPDLR